MAVEIVPYIEGVSKPPKRDLTKEPPLGMWTVVSFAGTDRRRRAYWQCRCKCGTERAVPQSCLLLNKSQGCGCTRLANLRKSRIVHDKRRTMEYGVWSSMIGRCHNENDQAFHNYGGRGIIVCQRWRDSFSAFLEDMGPRPSAKHSIERRENNSGYCPNNCYWATRKEQANNKRNNDRRWYKGEEKTVPQWAEYAGMHTETLRNRLRTGKTMVEAMETPVRNRIRPTGAPDKETALPSG